MTDSNSRNNSGLILAAVGLAALVGVGSFVFMGAGSGGAAPAKVNAATPKPASAVSIPAALDAARKLMKDSKWAQAQTVLREATAQFPEDQELRVAYAEALLGDKKPADAYEQYQAALAIGPREAKLEFIAGQVASTAGKHDRAVEHFSMAQSKDPKNAAVPLMLGLAQRQTGDLDAARATLLRAANMDPDNAFAWASLADMALSDNKLDLAAQHIGKARQIQPASKDFRVIEARILARGGKPEQALLVLTSLDPSQRRDMPTLRIMAQCYGMLGQPDNVAALWAEAFAQQPDQPELAYEAALAAHRAGNTSKALELALTAQQLGSADAADLVARLRN